MSMRTWGALAVLLFLAGCASSGPTLEAPEPVESQAPPASRTQEAQPEPEPVLRLPPPPEDEPLEMNTSTPIRIHLPEDAND